MHGSRWRREETGASRLRPRGTGRLPPTLHTKARSGGRLRSIVLVRGEGEADEGTERAEQSEALILLGAPSFGVGVKSDVSGARQAPFGHAR